MKFNRFIYRVPAMMPKGKNEEIRPGGYGFSTEIDGDFAVLARKRPMEDKRLEIFQSEGLEIIKRFKLKGIGLVRIPYTFVDNSLMLHYVQVPGDACDLGLEDMDDFFGKGWQRHSEFIERLRERGDSPAPVRYIPHNVDSFQQASALLALWLHWANSTTFILDE